MIELEPGVAVGPTSNTTVALAAVPASDAGVKVAVTPVGTFSAVNATVPAYPPPRLSDSVALPDAPRDTVPAVADSWSAMLGVTGGEVVPASPPDEQAARVSAERAERKRVGQRCIASPKKEASLFSYG